MEPLNEKRTLLVNVIAEAQRHLNMLDALDPTFLILVRREYIANHYKSKLKTSRGILKQKQLAFNAKLFDDIKPIIDSFDEMTGIHKLLEPFDMNFNENIWKRYV